MRRASFSKRSIVGLLLVALTASPLLASNIGMVTGSKTGTYIKFGRAIAAEAKKEGVTIVVKESEGSIANIERLNSTENAALAIVQSDVLGFLTRSDDTEMRKVAERLRLIFPFYNEEVHVFASKKIKSFQDLAGKRVVVGTEGSGTWLTATNLLEIAGVAPGEQMSMSTVDAVTAVLLGEADAMFYVAGKPVKLFTNLNNAEKEIAELLEQVHLVPLENPGFLNDYVSSFVGPDDYRWLKSTVPTVAVKAILISFDFSSGRNQYYDMRCRQLTKIGRAIRKNIETLKRTGHPKWKEVDLEGKLGIWKKDTCSRSAAAEPAPAKKNRLRDLIKKKLTQ